MCGIVGKYYLDQTAYRADDLDQMMQAIFHRGPDEAGSFCDDRAAIGFRRLSIIDTATGHQPLFNERSDLLAFVNGEIYNFRELRVDLEKRGHRFRTNSDCEVVVHLYEDFGPDFLPLLNGMFAICIYDTAKKSLLLARDRVGIKPLYLYQDSSKLCFASEIKGLLACNGVEAKLAEDVLDEYLCFRSLCNNRTFFSGIRAVEPGEYIVANESGIDSRRYWQHGQVPKLGLGTNDLINEITEAIESAVSRQLVSDVPLGALLSGGVDSSWVTALAGKRNCGLKTFTVGFEDAKYDETSYARIIAEQFGLDYHQLVLNGKQYADLLQKIVWFHDEPLNHANSVHIYSISKYAREHVKVVLTGEGADELFGGYPRYLICLFGLDFVRLSGPVKWLIQEGLDRMGGRRIEKLRSFMGMTPRELVLWNSRFLAPEKVRWLYEGAQLDLSYRFGLVDELFKANEDPLENLLHYEQRTYLQSILMRQDKLSMAASLESRVPMLDNAVLSLAESIPARRKLGFFQPKALLKRAAARKIPSQVVYKRKVGFGVPISNWLRDRAGLGRFFELLLDPSTNLGKINRNRLEQVVREHESNKANHEDVLWPLINFALWQHTFLR